MQLVHFTTHAQYLLYRFGNVFLWTFKGFQLHSNFFYSNPIVIVANQKIQHLNRSSLIFHSSLLTLLSLVYHALTCIEGYGYFTTHAYHSFTRLYCTNHIPTQASPFSVQHKLSSDSLNLSHSANDAMYVCLYGERLGVISNIIAVLSSIFCLRVFFLHYDMESMDVQCGSNQCFLVIFLFILYEMFPIPDILVVSVEFLMEIVCFFPFFVIFICILKLSSLHIFRVK